MALTDRLPASGIQPRLWMLTVTGRLVSRASEVPVGGWTHVASGMTTSVDAISFTDGATQRQRVYAFLANDPVEIVYDDDSFRAVRLLPPAAGKAFRDSDIAAVQWMESGSPRIAFSAVANDGSVCFWEGDTNSLGAPTCSAAGEAHTSAVEIDGVVSSGRPVFFYRTATRRLGRSYRVAPNQWWHSSLGTPPGVTSLSGSIAVRPSQLAGKIDIAFNADGGRMYLSRVTATGWFVDAWNELPSLPTGVSPADGRAKMDSVVTTSTVFVPPSSFTTRSYTSVYVQGSGALYALTSDSNGSFTGRTWDRKGAPRDHAWYVTGPAYAAGSILYQSPRVFGVAGLWSWVAADFSLHEYDGASFRDYIRPLHTTSGTVLGAASGVTHAANESMVAGYKGGLILQAATAIRRDNPPPWKVVLSDSLNGGHTFTEDFVLKPVTGFESRSSHSDPLIAVGPTAKIHHAVLQVRVTPTFGDACAPGGEPRVLVYRRGTTAEQIANMVTPGTDLHIIDEGDHLDHPGLALTGVGDADETAHVVYWTGSEVKHWRRTASAAPINVEVPGLRSAPAWALTDAGGNVYGFSFGGWSGRPRVCRVWPADGECGEVGAGTTGPIPFSPQVAFGSLNSALPCNGDPGQSCIDTGQPVGLATDPRTPGKIYAAYQGPVGPRTRLFFTVNEGGSLSAWREPVEVFPTGESFYDYLDPEVTVDHEGTILVSFTRIRPGDVAPLAENYLAMSTDGGVTFQVHRQASTWAAADLPFHCSRERHFLGEYRQGTTVANRAYNLAHVSSGGNTVLKGFWASRWSLDD